MEQQATLPGPLRATPQSRVSTVMRARRAVFWSGLLAVCLGSVAQATSDDVARVLWRRAPSALLTTPRDVDDFLAGFEPLMPRPVVLLSREDAVAQELLMRSRTLTQRQALRTAQAICAEALELGYDPLLFLAIIHVESFYNHLAISPVGAEGLMQLMPPTARWMAAQLELPWVDQHSFDPVLNVRLGIRYLVFLHRQFKRLDYALTAYNRGPYNTRYIVQQHGQLPPHVHDFYAGKVLDRYARLRARYGRLPLAQLL